MAHGPADIPDPFDAELTNGENHTPSPGTPGEGGGEGLRRAASRDGPHPNPLPEYREREPEAPARTLSTLSSLSAPFIRRLVGTTLLTLAVAFDGAVESGLFIVR